MTRSIASCLIIACFALSLLFPREAFAQGGEPRLALVVGNADYRAGPVATAANDAGLVADALRAAGFEVTGAANLDQEALRRAFREFLGKAAQAGPDAIAFVYLAGRGLQYEGENYFAPIDALIRRDADVPIEALRLSDFTRSLAALPLRARIVALDAARPNVFAQGGQPLASGLALVEPEPGALYGFNAAPGAVAPDESGPYGAYAQALAEMLREGGVSVDDAFSRVRLRVDEVTRGAVVPWDVSKIDPPIVLLPGDPDAPPVAARSLATVRSRPIREFPIEEAYAAAIERDTLAGYQEFLAAYPNGRFAERVRGLLAARREALTWRRTVAADAPNAYWTYMRRYPRGPHFADARRRLIFLSAPLEPPPRFEIYDFGDLPPPPPAEYEIIDQPVIVFAPDDYPPPPIYFLPPRPREFIDLPPPPPPPSRGFLPIPIPIPLPYARPNAPQGVVIQPNFGQQGPIGAGSGGGRHNGGQGFGQGGEPVQPPLAPAQQPSRVGPNVPPLGQPAPSGAPGQPLAPPPAGGAAAPANGLPQGARPGLAPTPLQPGGVQTAPPATLMPAPAQIQGEPNHALPQGKELPPTGGPKGRSPNGTSGAPGVGGPQDAGKPGLAPRSPAGPAGSQPGAHVPSAGQGAPPAVQGAPPEGAVAPSPSVTQPKAGPRHAPPQGGRPGAAVGQPNAPHVPSGGQTPVGKPETAPVTKPAPSARKPHETTAPKAAPQIKPRAPEASPPGAIAPHPNMSPPAQFRAPPAAGPQIRTAPPQQQQQFRQPQPTAPSAPPAQMWTAPQQQQQFRQPQPTAPSAPPAQMRTAPPPQQQLRAPSPSPQMQTRQPQAPAVRAPAPAANKPVVAPKPGETPHRQDQ